MHRHFRMIGISEYLRCRGYDPDVYPHTRIPNIWKELQVEFDLDIINERDNALDYVDVADYAKQYKEFGLPLDPFYEDVMARVTEAAASTTSSPAQWDPDASVPTSPTRPAETKKRKRTDTTRNRSSSVDSSAAPSSKRSAASPAPARGRGGRKRAASRAKAQSTESEPDEEEDESEEGEEEDEGEEEVSQVKAPRGGGRGRGRGRGRPRGRGRGRGRGG
jgi:chromatin modification-related protein EAF7